MRTFLVGITLLAAAAGPAEAASSGRSKHVQVELLPEVQWVQPGTPFSVAIHMKMDPGWHTYWINPGDAGLPIRASWTLPEGATAGPLQFPYPSAFTAASLSSYGYEDEVTLIADITPPAGFSGSTFPVAAALNWLECEKVCLPARASLDLALPVRAESPAANEAARAILAAARAKQPGDGTSWNAGGVTDGARLALTFTPPTPGLRSATFFSEKARVVEPAAPQRLLKTDGGYAIELTRDDEAEGVEALAGILVVEADGGKVAVNVRAPVQTAALPVGTPVAAGQAPPSDPLGIPAALGLAFVGGLILNLMPCVLPVLSLKVLGFVKHAGDEGGRPWRHGLAFTVGVVVSFLILAGALLVLRAGGQQIGWGFQLQSPRFVAGLAFLFFLIGLNLFGVFEVGASLTRAGGLTGRRSGLVSSFSDGALATIVATPCTAPFMGSALGFGLSQPAYVALLIFAALGLGMAAPYMLLSTAPALLRFVPKPGAWMETFKQLMGFFMMGTVVVLVWIFGRQAGIDAIAYLLAGMVVVGLGGWVYGRGAWAAPRARLISNAIALACAVAGIALGFSRANAMPMNPTAGAHDPDAIAWQPFSAEAVAEARAAGKAVFIDFTAAWCLSCQVNERLALQQDDVEQRFRAHGVAAFKADWTLQDERITEALRSYGRSGVPLYVLYAPHAGQPRLLPEVLTPDIVLRALDDAGVKAASATTE